MHDSVEEKTEKHLEIIDKVLRWWFVIPVLVCFTVLNVFDANIKSYIDTKFPPITDFAVISQTYDRENNELILNEVEFVKHTLRNCEVSKVKGEVYWVDKDGFVINDGFRILQKGKKKDSKKYTDRAYGKQKSRNWVISGISTLEGTQGFVTHYCGPSTNKRKKITRIYPSDNSHWWKYF